MTVGILSLVTESDANYTISASRESVLRALKTNGVTRRGRNKFTPKFMLKGYISKSTLTRAMSTTTSHTRDTGNSSSCTPRLCTGLVTWNYTQLHAMCLQGTLLRSVNGQPSPPEKQTARHLRSDIYTHLQVHWLRKAVGCSCACWCEQNSQHQGESEPWTQQAWQHSCLRILLSRNKPRSRVGHRPKKNNKKKTELQLDPKWRGDYAFRDFSVGIWLSVWDSVNVSMCEQTLLTLT